MPAKWTLDNALPIILAIDPIARRCNFSLALRGGVLLRGESERDLDLCFLSEEGPEFCSPARLLDDIAKGMPEQVERCNAPAGGDKYPHSIIRLRDGRHIDAFLDLKSCSSAVFIPAKKVNKHGIAPMHHSNHRKQQSSSRAVATVQFRMARLASGQLVPGRKLLRQERNSRGRFR